MLSARQSSNACSIGKCRDQLTRTPATPSSTSLSPTTHAARNRTAGVTVAAAALVWALWGLPAGASAGVSPSPQAAAVEARAPQAESPAAPAAGEPAATGAAHAGTAQEARQGEGEGETGHTESPWAAVARLFNFALLAGALVYFLRSPLMIYLDQRRVQVRGELAKAAALKAEAGAEMAGIDAKMAALPGELEALRRRGAGEIAAEEERIRAQAEAERQRLLDHAKREIETELRVAERELKARAGELAVDVATERVKRAITDADQARLLDRYVAQVKE